MRVIAKRALRRFWEKHSDAENVLKLWYRSLENSNWKSFSDLKADYSSADYVGNDRVVFNIKGNNYRIVAKVEYEYQVVFIKFVGTHSEYDKIDVKTVNDF